MDLSFALTFSLTRALASAMGDLGVQPAVSVPGPPGGGHPVGLGSCPHAATGGELPKATETTVPRPRVQLREAKPVSGARPLLEKLP